MTKKILSLVLSALLLFSLVPTFAFAADEFTIYAEDVEVEAGATTVDVKIMFANNPGVASLGFDVGYDAEAMTVTAVTNGTIFAETEFEALNATAMAENPILVSADCSDRPDLSNEEDDGVFVTITFALADGIEAGDYTITVAENTTARGGILNQDFQTVAATYTSGTVTVKAAAQDAPEAVVIMADGMTAVGGGGEGANVSTVEEGGMTYWRFDPKNPNNNGAAMHWTLNEAIAKDDYNYVKVGYKTNAATVANRAIAFVVTASDFSTQYAAESKWSYWPADAATTITEADVVFDISTKKDAAANVTEFKYGRILPTNGQVATAIDGTGEYYFDVEYIAFFNTKTEADEFDFDAYLDSLPEEYTITFQDKDGDEISSEIYLEGTTVTLPEAPAVYGYAFIGWSTGVEGEALVTEDFIAAANVTLKAVYEEVPVPLVVMADGMTAVGGGGEGANVSTVEEGGMTYWRFDPKNPNNNGAAMHWTLNEAIAKDDYNYVKVGYKTNAATVANRAIAFVVTASDFSTQYAAESKWSYWPADAATTITEADVVFNISTKKDAAANVTEFKYGRILPTNGQVATAIDGTGEYYFDVAYIAFFATEDEANEFNFASYLDSLYTVTFQNRLGAEISSKLYNDGEAVEFPEAPEVSGYTFVGWSADEGETFVEEGYVATADITLKAIYVEAADDKDYDTLETFITILKMITTKKKAAADTPVIPTTFEGIIYNAEDILGGRAVTEGVDTYNGVAGKLAGGKTVFAAADGKVRFTNSNIGAAATTSDRAIIKVDDVKLTEYPFIGIKYNTNIAAENINFNMTTKDGTYTSGEQKLFFPMPRTVGEDAACIAQYDGVKMGDAVATYIYVPIYSNTGAVSAAGDYFDVIAVGFFKTEADAKAFADYYGMAVEEPEAPVEEEPKEEEPVVTGEPVIYTPADLLTQIAPLTGELSTVEVDGKSYLRFSAAYDAEVMKTHAFNWTMATPLDTTVYKYCKIAFKTNVATVANGAMAVQISGDNTFNWQTKLFEVVEYGFWTNCTAESSIVHVFDMSEKIDTIGVNKIEYFRFIPFNGQIITTLNAADLYVDVEYIAFFKDAEEADKYGK